MGRALWIIGGTIVVIVVALATMKKTAMSQHAFAQARERAQDVAAHSRLQNALVTAKEYYTHDETYTGLDAKTAAGDDSSLLWQDDAPATEGVVSINVAEGEQLVMSTLSASGQAFCIADDAGSGTTFGSVDAVGGDEASCVGAWHPTPASSVG